MHRFKRKRRHARALHAILLAAGEGSRLRPFTADKPKPMVRAANKPIAQFVVEALVANGVSDVTFVVGYHREKVQSYFGDGRRFGARVTYAFQDPLTGTARALATAPAPREEFLVLGADNVVDASLIKAALGAPAGQPAIVAHRSDRPQRYGVVTLDGDRLTRIVEKPSHPRSEWVNTGVYRLPADYHARAAAIADTDGAGLPDLLQQAVADGAKVHAVRSEALWSDAVYPWDLLRVHADLLKGAGRTMPALPGVHVEAPVLVGPEAAIGAGTVLAAGTCIGSNVAVGANCVIENSILYDDVQVGPGTILRNTIVGAGTRLGPRVTALSDACDIQSVDGWHHLEDFGAVIGEDARIGGATTLLPGSVLGNQVTVAHGRTLHGAIPDRSNVL